MDTLERLRILGAAAKYDICAASSLPRRTPWEHNRSIGSSLPSGVCHSYLPDGRCISLFKVLMSNVCINDCAYCINQAGRNTPRTTFQPEELARLFLEFYQRNYVEGLFLSSGVASSPSETMEAMLKTVELLRFRYRFGGYIHLKILPGATFQYVERGCQLADRVSINMEAPSPHHLHKLSLHKDQERQILEPMKWIKQLSQDSNLVPAGQTTQFVVGAAGETDREIFQSAHRLYTQVNLRRAYFSAFKPIHGTKLEHLKPAPLAREHRLYQLDWLYRIYHFSAGELELAFDKNDNLTLKEDPKMVIALRRPELFPLDLNTATFQELLQVPGIGPTAARRIMSARRVYRITSDQTLQRMGVVLKRASPFLCLGKQPLAKGQTSFFHLLDEEPPHG